MRTCQAALPVLCSAASPSSPSAAAQASPAQLRAISTADFEKALEQVAPSSDTDSAGMTALQEWNSKYGEAATRGYREKLSYFI